ncbi:MAG: hypothetical protein A3D96_04610 [Chlamydiae bacterium RIFCSPHIGHO2_12_FULL_44_59]|nr:MAG: hypothetical protein A2796_02090 [Chlamydiae bacterium RIFCSPHIGHO2_01_FULL_44_39]OGN59687.1 MAG: hypothetical protein A3D96_04610 [Chlamydiae bacterium RIFCSPHIGHO2_12_FULL_44_59]OGN65764.1 MAG: hypothetical protein A2978_04950 [Chlamydiae bacterium RIFCSPLOWO2_01_FULL_44_52]OGN67926.1 MAG: hypothetical protein A3I67_00610 [Chlamydiae bacterium RIFCSPLOWO2_02_FULL_45_22]OGN69477.1 MAG: hypothetical protein A3F79_06335 [Chlamydiae bacterium RIFCSPLOWO2_12_FULL_45_20]
MKTYPTSTNRLADDLRGYLHPLSWERAPALYAAFTLLFGYGWLVSWIWPALWGLYLIILRKFPYLTLLVGSLFYIQFHKPLDSPVQGGYFSISSKATHYSPFQTLLLYKGILYTEKGSLPASIYIPSSKPQFSADCDYIVQGGLKKRDLDQAIIKPKKLSPVKHSWSLAEARYQLKGRFRHFLNTHLKKENTASFLGSLVTGDVEKRELRYQFGKLGLQHLLAISGFHFAILIAFASWFLQFFLSSRSTTIALLFVVNGYFLFVGSLPAVQRSYIMATLYLLGPLLNRHSNPLNLLGAAMLIELLLHPLHIRSIGFQLSFACCGGIFLLYPPIKQKLASFLTPLKEPSLLSCWGRKCSLFFVQSIGLSLAVNLAIWPLLLYHFHTFPILSLFYNLFFPYLVSMALFLFLLSVAVHLIFPPLSSLCFWATDRLTAELLGLAAYPPIALDYSLTAPHFPFWVIPVYLAILLQGSILARDKVQLNETPFWSRILKT